MKKKRRGKKVKPVLDRLFSRTFVPYDTNGIVNNDKCWNWTGVTNNAGYGMMRVDHEVHMATVHRIMYIEHYKTIKYGSKLQVLHECGNKLCVNPNHLKLGNHKDRAELQRRYGSYNTVTFNDKKKMWPVCEHCGKTDYLPHFRRLHSKCEHNAKVKRSINT